MFHGERNYNFLTFTTISLPHFNYSHNQQILVGFLHFLLIFKGKCLVDTAICNVQEVDVGYLLVAFYIEDVYVVQGIADHLAAASVVLQQHVLFLDNFCLFKPQFACQLLHLSHHLALQIGCISFQYFLGFCNMS